MDLGMLASWISSFCFAYLMVLERTKLMIPLRVSCNGARIV